MREDWQIRNPQKEHPEKSLADKTKKRRKNSPATTSAEGDSKGRKGTPPQKEVQPMTKKEKPQKAFLNSTLAKAIQMSVKQISLKRIDINKSEENMMSYLVGSTTMILHC
jgi:hypothetical protein